MIFPWTWQRVNFSAHSLPSLGTSMEGYLSCLVLASLGLFVGVRGKPTHCFMWTTQVSNWTKLKMLSNFIFYWLMCNNILFHIHVRHICIGMQLYFHWFACSCYVSYHKVFQPVQVNTPAGTLQQYQPTKHTECWTRKWILSRPSRLVRMKAQYLPCQGLLKI